LSWASYGLAAILVLLSVERVGQPTFPTVERPAVIRTAVVAPFPTQPRPPSSDFADGALKIGGSVRTPFKTRHVDPVYPPEAQASSVEGTVLVEMRIDETGLVSHARVVQSVPFLDQAALDAVRQWRFTPTFLDNSPVPVVMTAAVTFDLR
jgi:TonB family protein